MEECSLHEFDITGVFILKNNKCQVQQICEYCGCIHLTTVPIIEDK